MSYDFTPFTNFAQDRTLMGLTSVQFDTDWDDRIRKLGMIYFMCGDWTPPDESTDSETPTLPDDPDVNDG